MQTKAVERMPNDALEGKLTDIIPGLVKVCDNEPRLECVSIIISK